MQRCLLPVALLGLFLLGCGAVPAGHPMRNIQIVNNTFYDNGLDWGGGVYVENVDIEAVIIRNNICSQNLTFQIALGEGVPVDELAVDHNLIDGFRGEPGEIYGTDYVEGAPLFVDPAGGDLHLRDASPAIDQGSALAAPGDDFDGNARPYGPGYDIGADEYVAYTHLAYLPIVYRGS